MDRDSLFKDFKGKLRSIEESFASELASLQTGRAHPSLLDSVMVEAYESRLPLNQVASIMVEAATLRVTPFEAANIEAVRNAIAGFERTDFNPTDDGRCVYVQVPPLTAERRQQIVKSLRALKEDYHIRQRQARHHALKELKEITPAEEALRAGQKQIDTISSQAKEGLDVLADTKEKEITTL